MVKTQIAIILKREYICGQFFRRDEVMEWMLDIQLGRRNLSPIQRIAVAEKYRPIYEKQAKENISKAVSESNKNRVNPILVNLPNMGKKIESVNTSEKLASIADVSEKTYRMGAKILQSDDEQLKHEVLSGQKSISAGYKELTQSTDRPNSAQRKNHKNGIENGENYSSKATANKVIKKNSLQNGELNNMSGLSVRQVKQIVEISSIATNIDNIFWMEDNYYK